MIQIQCHMTWAIRILLKHFLMSQPSANTHTGQKCCHILPTFISPTKDQFVPNKYRKYYIHMITQVAYQESTLFIHQTVPVHSFHVYSICMTSLEAAKAAAPNLPGLNL